MTKLTLLLTSRLSLILILVSIAITVGAQSDLAESWNGLMGPSQESNDASDSTPPGSTIFYDNGSIQTFATRTEDTNTGNPRSAVSTGDCVYSEDFDSGSSGWSLTRSTDNEINCVDGSAGNSVKLKVQGVREAITPGILIEANLTYDLMFDYWTPTFTSCPDAINCENPDGGDEMHVQYSTSGTGGPWTTILTPAYTGGTKSSISIPITPVSTATYHFRFYQPNNGAVNTGGVCTGNMGVDHHLVDNICVFQPCDKYVIISEENMEIEETTVHSGGIGVLNEDEEAKIDDNSMVIAAGTFVKAPEVVVKDGSVVNTIIEEQADPCMPDFLSNFSAINNDVEVEEGETVILDEIFYDDIEAEEGATLIFSGHGNVYIEDFIMDKNVTVIFDQCTNLRVKEDFELGKDNVFNNEGQNVGVYAGYKIEFKGRNIAKGLFYSLGDLIVQSGKSITRNQLYGQFIGEEVEVEKYTDFYYQNFTPCDLPPAFIEQEQELLAASQYGYDLENEIEILVSKPDVLNIVDLSVSPNPFNAKTNINFKLDQEDYVTVEIYNLNGQLINPLFSGVMAAGSQNLNWNGDTSDGNKLQNGIYLVILKTNEQVITKKISLIK